jgi:hypothetical protein
MQGRRKPFENIVISDGKKAELSHYYLQHAMLNLAPTACTELGRQLYGIYRVTGQNSTLFTFSPNAIARGQWCK